MVVPKISWVTNATDTDTQDVSANKVLEVIRTGGKVLRARVEEIRNLIAAGDKGAASELKRKLHAVLWSGAFSQRKNDALTQHSGLSCAVLASLNRELPGGREKLKASPHLWGGFLSPPGEGLKAVFRVPADASTHAGSFRSVKQHVLELTGVQIDESGKDVARLCFLSYDPDLYHNPGARELESLHEPVKPKPINNGMANLSERQRMATELLGAIDWQSETEGYCMCPNQAAHTTANGARDCKVWLGEIPTISCFHNSCRGVIEGLNHTLRSRIGKAEAPAKTAGMSDRACRILGAQSETGNGSKANMTQLSSVAMLPIEFVDKPL